MDDPAMIAPKCVSQQMSIGAVEMLLNMRKDSKDYPITEEDVVKTLKIAKNAGHEETIRIPGETGGHEWVQIIHNTPARKSEKDAPQKPAEPTKPAEPAKPTEPTLPGNNSKTNVPRMTHKSGLQISPGIVSFGPATHGTVSFGTSSSSRSNTSIRGSAGQTQYNHPSSNQKYPEQAAGRGSIKVLNAPGSDVSITQSTSTGSSQEQEFMSLINLLGLGQNFGQAKKTEIGNEQQELPNVSIHGNTAGPGAVQINGVSVDGMQELPYVKIHGNTAGAGAVQLNGICVDGVPSFQPGITSFGSASHGKATYNTTPAGSSSISMRGEARRIKGRPNSIDDLEQQKSAKTRVLETLEKTGKIRGKDHS